MPETKQQRSRAEVLLAEWAGLAITLSLGFFLLAIPQRLLESGMGAMHLASTAAPFGVTARVLIALGCAIPAGAFVGLLFLLPGSAKRAPVAARRTPLSPRRDLGDWMDPLPPHSPADKARAPAAPFFFDIETVKNIAPAPDQETILDLGSWKITEEAGPIGIDPSATDDNQDTIDALMRRLEDGIAKREQTEGKPPLAAVKAGDTQLQSTLAELRKLAGG